MSDEKEIAAENSVTVTILPPPRPKLAARKLHCINETSCFGLFADTAVSFYGMSSWYYAILTKNSAHTMDLMICKRALHNVVIMHSNCLPASLTTRYPGARTASGVRSGAPRIAAKLVSTISHLAGAPVICVIGCEISMIIIILNN